MPLPTLFERQQAAAEKLCARYPEISKQEFRGDYTLTIPKELFYDAMRYAKEACGFDMLLCVSSVDRGLDAEPRFESNYTITQAETGANLLIRVLIEEDSMTVASVEPLWKAANWLEREQYDMMGIIYDGHPDLRRILMWDEYPYHPMHKDFPVEGKPTELPGVAFTEKAPMRGAPFITRPGTTAAEREPRQRG